MVIKIENGNEKEQIARYILENLPDWFGIQESINEYVQVSRELPVWADIEDQELSGFIALKETSRYTAEIYVMGVLQNYHRKGVGRELFKHLYKYAKEYGYEYLQVKTVEEGRYKEYDLTNTFYKSLGFRELECFKNLWDESNPCQIYIVAIN